MSALIGQATRAGLAGLETLVGIPGSVGGAVRCNAGDRSADIGQFVRELDVLDGSGNRQVRKREEMHFDDHGCNLDDPILLAVELELDSDHPDAIHKRMLKAWIHRKAAQPLSLQAAARIFRNLMRAGFGLKTIFGILKKWDVEDEVLEKLESEDVG